MASAESLSRSSSLQDGAGKRLAITARRRKPRNPRNVDGQEGACLVCNVPASVFIDTLQAYRGIAMENQGARGALRKVCPDEKLLKEIYARVDEESDTTFDSEFGHLTPLPGPSRE
ncbi:hypothetical protein BDQ17DRAFT_1439659 [Cyathus striatus]|nr:hypothetical protein BDQ17DRAFT_1439659 [Cyathus striatus]